LVRPLCVGDELLAEDLHGLQAAAHAQRVVQARAPQ
jgi:hypothetical protein